MLVDFYFVYLVLFVVEVVWFVGEGWSVLVEVMEFFIF